MTNSSRYDLTGNSSVQIDFAPTGDEDAVVVISIRSDDDVVRHSYGLDTLEFQEYDEEADEVVVNYAFTESIDLEIHHEPDDVEPVIVGEGHLSPEIVDQIQGSLDEHNKDQDRRLSGPTADQLAEIHRLSTAGTVLTEAESIAIWREIGVARNGVPSAQVGCSLEEWMAAVESYVFKRDRDAAQHVLSGTSSVLRHIEDDVRHQLGKHGLQRLSIAGWNMVIGEEAGEVVQALNQKNYDEAIKEIKQTIACYCRLAVEVERVQQGLHVTEADLYREPV